MIDNREAVVREIHNKRSLMANETFLHDLSLNEEYILDRTDIKVIFITLYTIVFISCFLGNLMVIIVVTFSRRLRSITNFFLANLAIADFCVGIFCVYQTLTNYLMNSWQLGDLLCKVYMFVHALSYTASVLILVVVCVERYLAIVYPIKCRFVLTRSRLQFVIMIVWIVAAIYAFPKFFYVETMRNRLVTGDVDIICIANIKKHNKTLLDVVNLVFLYLLPLLLMSCLYSRIAIGLRRSCTTLGNLSLTTKNKDGSLRRVHASSRNELRARRGVIRMLITVVMMFAICNLPQQARIAWRHLGLNYDRTSDFSTLLTLSTFLISYTNSCLNPLLYAFLSRNFQKGMRELFGCRRARERSSVLAMGYTGDTGARHETSTNLPRHSSLTRFNSEQDSTVAARSSGK
ncbi:PREDICTED: gastrin/cholecystokinin type B receptor-like [Eufriesea mexicana]|uniref:gastrin/cholecystokinin type B receptor-like n=1 Tax=Eufriesea mexicana TaxID=516756 RepID=UPI00083C7434|nr:PREDICTED: gastrin/cholecystokinin type B receptor-like [Eufriesea mexicana]